MDSHLLLLSSSPRMQATLQLSQALFSQVFSPQASQLPLQAPSLSDRTQLSLQTTSNSHYPRTKRSIRHYLLRNPRLIYLALSCKQLLSRIRHLGLVSDHQPLISLSSKRQVCNPIYSKNSIQDIHRSHNRISWPLCPKARTYLEEVASSSSRHSRLQLGLFSLTFQ